MSDTTHAPEDTDRDPKGRRRVRRLGVLAVVASFVGIWGYVMYLSIFVGRAEPPNRIHDERYRVAAETVCAQTREQLDRLPLAAEMDTPAERADLLDAATDLLDGMVSDLEVLDPPATERDRAGVRAWLDDYRTYLQDRRRHAEAQRHPDDTRYDQPIAVTDRGGFQIDVLIEDLAHVSYMDSCRPPGDV